MQRTSRWKIIQGLIQFYETPSREARGGRRLAGGEPASPSEWEWRWEQECSADRAGGGMVDRNTQRSNRCVASGRWQNRREKTRRPNAAPAPKVAPAPATPATPKPAPPKVIMGSPLWRGWGSELPPLSLTYSMFKRKCEARRSRNAPAKGASSSS